MLEQYPHFTIKIRLAANAVLLRDDAEVSSASDGAQSVLLISGSSVTGLLRAHSERIASTISGDERATGTIIKSLFGSPSSQPARVVCSDARFVMKAVETRVHVSLDKKASKPALHQFRVGDGTIKMCLEIRPEEQSFADPGMGLMLLVIRDLLSGEVPLLNGRTHGYGQVIGSRASITQHSPNQPPQTWLVERSEGGSLLISGDEVKLEEFLSAFRTALE